MIDLLAARRATDLKGNIRAVLARLSERPTTVTVADPVSGRGAPSPSGRSRCNGSSPQGLGDPRLVATLRPAFRQMAEGRFEGVAQILLVRRARVGLVSAMKHMMDVSSGASPDRRRQIHDEARDALLGHAISFPGMFLAEAWAPVTDLGDDFRRPITSAVPTLILVGDLDPRTPVANAHEIAPTLSAAQVVVLKNARHQFDVFGSPPVRDVLAHFLQQQSVADRIPLAPIVFQSTGRTHGRRQARSSPCAGSLHPIDDDHLTTTRYTGRIRTSEGCSGFRCRHLDGRAAILVVSRETRRMCVERLVQRVVHTAVLRSRSGTFTRLQSHNAAAPRGGSRRASSRSST